MLWNDSLNSMLCFYLNGISLAIFHEEFCSRYVFIVLRTVKLIRENENHPSILPLWQ